VGLSLSLLFFFASPLGLILLLLALLQVIEKIAVHFLEGMNCKQQKIVGLVSKLNLSVHLERIVLPHTIVTVNYLFLVRRQLLILNVVTDIFGLGRIPRSFEKIKILASVVPRGRVCPYISTVIQNDVVF
jgi:hypothetical protein